MNEYIILQLVGALGCLCLMFAGERDLGLIGLSGVGFLNGLAMAQQDGRLIWHGLAIVSAVVCVSYVNKCANYTPKPWLPILRAWGNWFVQDYHKWKETGSR